MTPDLDSWLSVFYTKNWLWYAIILMYRDHHNNSISSVWFQLAPNNHYDWKLNRMGETGRVKLVNTPGISPLSDHSCNNLHCLHHRTMSNQNSEQGTTLSDSDSNPFFINPKPNLTVSRAEARSIFYLLPRTEVWGYGNTRVASPGQPVGLTGNKR